jgi:hypothetical protein
VGYAAAHSSVRTSACARTVRVARSCLSGVAVLAEDPLDEDPQLRPDVVADRPVDRDVRADGGGQLTGDRQQLGLTEDRHRAVVRFEGVVEGELVIGEAQFDTARVGRAHVGRQGDQLLDDLGCLDRPVLVAAQRLFQKTNKKDSVEIDCNPFRWTGIGCSLKWLERRLSRDGSL